MTSVLAVTGIIAPANTPESVADKPQAVLSTVLSDPTLPTALGKIAQNVLELSPSEFKKHASDELQLWKKTAAQAGLASL